MDTQHHLYTIRPTRQAMLAAGATEAESAILSRHFTYLQELTEAGTLFMAGRTLTTGPESMGIVIINSRDEPTARAIMEDDPAVAEGVMTAVLFPFRISLHGR